MARGMVGFAHFEADQWFEQRGHDWQPFLLTHAHRWCREQTEKALKAGRPVVVANTFTRHWELDEYVRLALDLGVPVRVVTATGNYGSVHNVPPEKIEQMAERWEPLEDGSVTERLSESQKLKPVR